jgi:hypothetical protein
MWYWLLYQWGVFSCKRFSEQDIELFASEIKNQDYIISFEIVKKNKRFVWIKKNCIDNFSHVSKYPLRWIDVFERRFNTSNQ